MKQIVRIARKEIMIALREKLVIALLSIVVILLGVALYTGYLGYRQQHSMISQKQDEKRQEWLNQGDKHPHIAAHYGTFVFKPKTLLSIFDFGLDAYTGTSVYLEAHHPHEFMFRPAQDHSSMIRFGELSVALVLQILVPLLIIFLSFGTYTSERESGTLKLLISQGSNFRTLTLGKVLAYFVILCAVLLPLVLGMFLLSFMDHEHSTIPDILVRVVLLALVYAVYLFLFVVLSVWVSLRSSTGRNALLTLLSCWIFYTILMPKTVANLSESFYELPSMREFKALVERDKVQGLDGNASRADRMASLEKEYLQKYQVDSVQLLPFNFEAVQMQAGEDHGNMVYDHHQNEIRAIFQRQNHLASISSLLNPFMAVEHLSMALAGTDMHTFTDFEDSVEDYRRDLVRRMNKDMQDNSEYGEFFGYKASRDLWEDINDFSYQTPTAWETLRNYPLELLSLLIWMVMLLILISFTNKKIKPLHG